MLYYTRAIRYVEMHLRVHICDFLSQMDVFSMTLQSICICIYVSIELQSMCICIYFLGSEENESREKKKKSAQQNLMRSGVIYSLTSSVRYLQCPTYRDDMRKNLKRACLQCLLHDR